MAEQPSLAKWARYVLANELLPVLAQDGNEWLFAMPSGRPVSSFQRAVRAWAALG